VKALRQLVARHSEGLEKLLPQNFSRVNPPVRRAFSLNIFVSHEGHLAWIYDSVSRSFCFQILMIVSDFDLERIVTAPDKANSIPVVDANTMLPLPISPQLF
jgi:hypothetical protein